MTSFITVLDQVRREAAPVRIVVLDKLAAQAVNACTWCSKAFSNQLAMRAVGCGPTFVEAIQIFLKSAEVLYFFMLVLLYLFMKTVCIFILLCPVCFVFTERRLKTDLSSRMELVLKYQGK